MPIGISEAPHMAGASAQADWRLLAAIIDHTLLKPDAKAAEIEQLCREAVDYSFGCVVLNPCNVALASSLLAASNVKVASVVGFPFGATTTAVKRYEALEAIKLGAREIDMVMNIGALKSGDRARVQTDMRGDAQVVHDNAALLKVTISTS